jgi:radical SAM superfamily enzyme YgiQ (UPF0313 family)
MSLDALIIADCGNNSLSESSALRLTIDDQPATIQAVRNYLAHDGRILHPVEDDHLSWISAPKLNGIALLSDLTRHGYRAELVNDFAQQLDLFLRLLTRRPRTIIVSTTFIVGKQALMSLINTLRTVAPGVPILAGGPLINLSFRLYQRRNEPSYIVPGLESDYLFLGGEQPDVDLLVTTMPGQTALHAALDQLRNGEALTGIPDTAWRDKDGEYVFGPKGVDQQEQPEDHIDWDSLPDHLFASGVIPLQASSGCPYSCAFCNFVMDKHRTYAKSIDNIIAEMTAVARRGVKYVWFVDDIFRLGRHDLDKVCEAMIAANLDMKWMTLIRADTVAGVDFDLLHRAGCVELQFGLESADPEVLAAMNKRADPDTYRTAVQGAMTAGINVSAYFVIGHPGETKESLERTIAFIKEIQYPDLPGSLSWSIYPFLLVPLSPIFEPKQRAHYQLEGYMGNWAHSTMDVKTAIQGIKRAVLALEDSAPVFRTDNLAMLEELTPLQRKAFFSARLKLAKLAATGHSDTETVRRTFADVLS